jgi:hypothetical protein
MYLDKGDKSSKMIWYTLIFDDTEGDWKLYDWG